MREENKFLLVLGDTEGCLRLQDDMMKLRDTGLNFEQSPCMGAVYEIYSEYAKEYSERLREEGWKVGVYASMEKAHRFFWKTLGFSSDGSMDFDRMESINLRTLGGGES